VGRWASDLAAPGRPAPEARVRGAQGEFHLTQCFGRGFVGMVFGADGETARIEQVPGFTLVHLPRRADAMGQAGERYGVAPGAKALVVVRPDGYVFGRWDRVDLDAARAGLTQRGVQP